MKRFSILSGLLSLVLAAQAGLAAPTLPALETRAAALAQSLAAACPPAAYNDVAAFHACATSLRSVSLPFLSALAWGGDQPDRQIKKKTLTHFNSTVFQTLYLPLFDFTGRWSLTEDPRTHTPIIRVEAFFRNALPAGEYPYPFWHSADKWSAYETANEIRFYLDPQGEAFIVTRDSAGEEANRGSYAHITPPAFGGSWQWRDASGALQPHASLLSARYSAANPFLHDVDEAYRAFALRLRDESCLNCHTPANKAEAERLVLLQTPLHAAGEIDEVISAVEKGEMPQDDVGLRKPIPADRRAAILQSAIAFRDRLRQADVWETTKTQ